MSNFNDTIVIIIHDSWFRKGIPISENNPYNQTISVVIDDKTRDLTFVKEWDTISCFLLFKRKKNSSKKIQKHVIHLHFLESSAQSTSK